MKTKPRQIEPVYRKLAVVITTLRLTVGLTQVELAKKMGISRAALANMEAGRQGVLLHTLLKFDKVFHLKAGSLVRLTLEKKFKVEDGWQ